MSLKTINFTLGYVGRKQHVLSTTLRTRHSLKAITIKRNLEEIKKGGYTNRLETSLTHL